MWNYKNVRSLLVWLQRGIATWEDILTVSYKQNLLLHMIIQLTFFCINPNELKTSDHTKTYTWILDFFYKYQNSEAIVMSFDRVMDKQTGVSHDGILLDDKKKGSKN